MIRIKKIIVEVPLNSISGYIVHRGIKKNTLLKNMYRLLYGIFSHTIIPLITIDNIEANANTPGDITYRGAYGAMYFQLCSENTFIGFSKGGCTQVALYDDVQVNHVDTGSSIIIEAIRTATTAANSICVGILYNTSYGAREKAAISHIVKDINTNDVIRYKLTIGSPWVRNFGLFMVGIFKDANVNGLVDVVGQTFTVRTSGDPTAGKAFLAIGMSNDPWSWDDNELRPEIDLNTWWTRYETSDSIVVEATGVYQPDEEVDIAELGLIQDLYDTGGNSHKTLLLRYVFPQPIHLTPQDIVVFGLRIVGGVP